jgi:hypothetical protein
MLNEDLKEILKDHVELLQDFVSKKVSSIDGIEVTINRSHHVVPLYDVDDDIYYVVPSYYGVQMEYRQKKFAFGKSIENLPTFPEEKIRTTITSTDSTPPPPIQEKIINGFREYYEANAKRRL